jgi:NitT/TauT family transport system substrate-binding protein
MHPISLQEPFRALFYAPFYAALARGAYAAEGVAVRFIDSPGPSLQTDAVLEGRADLAWGGPMRLLLAHDRDPACPLRLFGAVVMGDPFLLVGRAPNPGFALTDLARLTLGSVSEVPTPWWCLQDDIRAAGLDPTALTRMTDRSMAGNAAAVMAGDLDVAQVFEPHAALLEAQGGAVWHRAADRGPSAYTAFYATERRIAERSDAFEAMIRAMAEALSWTYAAPAEEIAATVAPMFPDVPRPALTASLARYQGLGLWSRTPHFPREAFEQLQRAMRSAGVITGAPAFEACVDEAIVTRALGA